MLLDSGNNNKCKIVFNLIEIIKYILMLIAMLFLGASIWYGCIVYLNHDPQGDASSNCIKEELVPVANGMGDVVTAHQTACSGFGATVAIYVYVHPSDKLESKDSLVLRFDEYGGGDDRNPFPTVQWIDKNNLLITVEGVDYISKGLNRMGDINIAYSIGKIDHALLPALSRDAAIRLLPIEKGK